MKNLRFLALASLVLAISACDYVMVPIDEEPLPPPPPGEFRNVLYEDISGQNCGNCPRADVKISQLQGVYEDQLIPVTIHAGWLAAQNNPYTPNLSCSDAETYNTSFSADQAGKPGIIVNRTECGGFFVSTPSASEPCVADMALLPRIVDLSGTATYNSSAEQITLEVEMTTREPLTGDYKLIAYLTEDHVEAPQLVYATANHPSNTTGGDITVNNFDHRHILRDVLTDPWGEDFVTGGAAGNETFQWQGTFSFNAAEWDINESEIIIYVREGAGDEVIEATLVPITQ